MLWAISFFNYALLIRLMTPVVTVMIINMDVHSGPKKKKGKEGKRKEEKRQESEGGRSSSDSFFTGATHPIRSSTEKFVWLQPSRIVAARLLSSEAAANTPMPVVHTAVLCHT